MGITSFQDAQRASVYTKALKLFDDLNDSEKLQFISMVQGLLRVWEEAFFQFQEDRLDNRVWDSMVAQYSDWMSSRGFQRVWEIRKHTYNPDFQKYVNELDCGEYRLSSNKAATFYVSGFKSVKILANNMKIISTSALIIASALCK
jgi:hypothetical protein